MAQLIKNQAITYIPGTAGRPGYPGQPYRSARTTTDRVRVCSYTPADTAPIYALAIANPNTGYRIPSGGKRCTMQTVTIYQAEQPYIAPIPSIPASPATIIYNFKLGWNGRSRSIDFLKGPGRFTFTIPVSDVGAVVGLSRSPQKEGFNDILHGFYVAHGVIRVYESGVEVLYVGGIPNAVLSITRTNGAIEYRVDGTLEHTGVDAGGSMYLAASLYSGGDSVLAYSMVEWGESVMDSGFKPMQGFMGTESYAGAAGSFKPMTGSMSSVRRAQMSGSMKPMVGNLADGTGYCQITSSFKPMTDEVYGFGLEPEYSLGYGFMLPMQGVMTCLTGRIASMAGSTRPMSGWMADRPYASIQSELSPMVGYAENYLLPGQGVLTNYLFGVTNMTAGVTLYAIINANMQVTGLMQVQTTATGSIPVGLSASASMEVQLTVKAFIESLFQPSAGAFDQAGEPLTVWALNMDMNGSTRYEGYDFNSFAEIGGLYYGAKYDGLYLLEGPDDAGTAVDASVNFGNLNFGTIARKALPYLYCGVASNGNLILKVVADGATHLYTVRDNTELLKAHRFEPGRGLRASYYDITIMNEGGTAFDLAEIEFFPLALSRKL